MQWLPVNAFLWLKGCVSHRELVLELLELVWELVSEHFFVKKGNMSLDSVKEKHSGSIGADGNINRNQWSPPAGIREILKK